MKIHNSHMDNQLYQQLLHRIGEDHLRKRLTRQIDDAASFYARGGYTSLHLENIEVIPIVLKWLLKFLGLYQRGLKNVLAYRVEHVQVPIPDLPEQFEGFRILQFSDLHTDGMADNGSKLFNMINKIKPDLCVLTGDFRFMTQSSYKVAISLTEKLIRSLDDCCASWGILGNHDFIEFVPDLEAAGIKMLLNEAVRIEKEGAGIWLAGIDDAHIYDCHDIKKAMQNIPPHETAIMLSHTPETYVESEQAGVDYFICGHTHGGQVCLPGGIPLITNAACPRRFVSGAWVFRNMRGYTSRGTGSSGLPVRFFCPPEITIHELVQKNTTV
jgi:uncharacterized protein